MLNEQISKLKNINKIEEKAPFIIIKKDKKLTNEELKFEDNKNPIILLHYISLVKILSAFSVVILHTNGIGVYWNFKNKYEIYKHYFISANLIECILNFAVPLFFLCIGATLLGFNKRYGLKIYFIKRINKVAIPLLSWNIILYFYKVYVLKNQKKIKFTFEELWNLYYGNKIYNIFGSIHSFILVYLIIPLLAFVEESKKIKIYSYCFITLFITQVLIPYLIKIFHLNLVLIYQIKIGHLIYIFGGYIIHHYRFHYFYKIIIYLIGVVGLLILSFGTKILTIRYKKTIILHKGYLNFPCMVYSCSLFLFIKDNCYLLFRIINKKYINKIGSLTMGSFFLHFPLIDTYIKYFKINKLSLKFRLFDGFFICCICLIITYIFKKIPLIKYLVP